MSNIKVMIMGGPQSGQVVSVSKGSTHLGLAIVRKLDSLDLMGPDDPVPMSNKMTIIEMPIHHGGYGEYYRHGHYVLWSERKLVN